MKVSIHFSLAPGKSSDLPIRMRVSYEGIRLDIRTGLVCPPGKWAGERMKSGCVNRYGESASDINSALSEQEALVLRILRKYDLDGSIPSTSTLKREFDSSIGRKVHDDNSGDTISDLFKKFLKSSSATSWSHGTSRQRISFSSVLSSYSISNKRVSSLSVEDMDDMLKEMIGNGLENQTIKSYISSFKTCLRWARKAGLYDGNIPEVFTPRLKGIGHKDVYYLEWSEVERIFNADLPIYREAAARDAFCLCCATGLRISDCLALKWSNVRLNADTPALCLIAQKTKKQTIIELNKWSMEVLRRRYELRDSDYVFRPMHYCMHLYHLRSVAKRVNLDRIVRVMSFSGTKDGEEYKPIYEVIASHWGRHTFIVRALSLGIAPTTIMAWTGHSSYESMKPYIAVVDQTKKDSMMLFDK